MRGRVTVAVGELLGVYSARDVPVVLIVYRARDRVGTARPGPEALELRWAEPESIPWEELAFPSTATALNDWRRTPAR